MIAVDLLQLRFSLLSAVISAALSEILTAVFQCISVKDGLTIERVSQLALLNLSTTLPLLVAVYLVEVSEMNQHLLKTQKRKHEETVLEVFRRQKDGVLIFMNAPAEA